MIHNNLKYIRHLLSPMGQIFVNPINNVFVQFALAVDHPYELPDLLEKIKNSTAGLYLKTDGIHLFNNFQETNSIEIHPIPKEVKTLIDCCDYICNTYTPDPRYSLATICADETRVVINSNHAITDGGYFTYFLNDVQDPLFKNKFARKAPEPRDIITDLFKKEFDAFLSRKDKDHFSTIGYNDITRLKSQEMTDLPDHYNKSSSSLRATIKTAELSPCIFNKKTRKIKHLTEFLWTGLCMAINAKNNEFGPFGVGSCMNFRRLLPREKVDQSFGSAYSDFFLAIHEVSPRMTIKEICSLFRANFNKIKNTDFFYKEYMFPTQCLMENCPISDVSNVGPIRIKSPLKDFYIQCSSNEYGLRPFLQVTSFSKLKKEDGINDLMLHLRYSPFIVSTKNASEIFDTFLYFLKNVNESKKSGDVLDELIHFQKSLE